MSLDEDDDDGVVLSAPFSGGLPIPTAVLLDVVLAGVAAGSARDDVVREGVAGTLFEESLKGVAATAAAPRLREAADGVALELPLSVERTSIVARLLGRPGVDRTPEPDSDELSALARLSPALVVALLPLDTFSSREGGLGLVVSALLAGGLVRTEEEEEEKGLDEVEVEVVVERGGEVGGEKADGAASLVREVEEEVEEEEEVVFGGAFDEVGCLVGTREEDPACGN